MSSRPCRDPSGPPIVSRPPARILIILALAGVALPACGALFDAPAPGPGTGDAAAGTPAPTPPGPWFADVTESSGVDFRVVNGDPEQLPIIDQNGQGVALLDHDGDGDLDLYLVNGSTIARWKAGENPGNRLYRNRGDGTFEDVTERAGVRGDAWGCGAAVADFDGDGHVDLYVTNWGPNVLYRNAGDGTFADVTEAAGVGDPAWSSSAAFGDVDGDGDLDLYVSNYVRFDPDDVPTTEKDGKPCLYKGVVTGCGPWVYDGERDTLYRNDGDGTFEDVSEAAGLAASAGYRGFGIVLADLDLDDDLDAYVGCDVMPNLYLVNDGKGVFTPAPAGHGGLVNALGKHESGMGVAAADVDRDGDLDLFTTNFAGESNTLYLNEEGVLTDATAEAGVGAHPVELGWGCTLADLDDDGILDLYVANGQIYPQVKNLGDPAETYDQRERLYVGLGDGRFREAGAGDGWTPAAEHSSRGLAVGDLDGDGDLDLVVVRHNGPVSILRNERGARRGRSLTVTLRGRAPNTGGIGARLRVQTSAGDRWGFALPHQGFQSSHDPRLHFGLAPGETVEAVEVRWPSGRRTAREKPSGGAVEVTEPAR